MPVCGFIGCTLVAALLTGCREGQKTNLLKRGTAAEQTTPAANKGNLPPTTAKTADR
jgi:hypothetical protein